MPEEKSKKVKVVPVRSHVASQRRADPGREDYREGDGQSAAVRGYISEPDRPVSKHEKVSHVRLHSPVDGVGGQPRTGKHDEPVRAASSGRRQPPEMPNTKRAGGARRGAAGSAGNGEFSDNAEEKLKKIKGSMNRLESEQDSRIQNTAGMKKQPSENQVQRSNSRQDRKIYDDFRKSAGYAYAMRSRKKRVEDEPDSDFTTRKQEAEAVEMETDTKARIITIVLTALLVAAIVVVYFIGYNGFKGRYLRNTYVNGVNISGVEIGKANNLIASASKISGITVVLDNGKKVNFDGSQYGCKYSMPKGAKFGDEDHKLWFSKYFTSTSYNVKLNSTYNENALRALIKNYKWGETGPTDAYIEKDGNGKYKVVPEKHGDVLDNDKFAEFVVKQVAAGKDTIYVDKADCYVEADVKKEDLQAELDLVNSTGKTKINIKFGDKKETIDSDTLSSWVSLDDEGNFQIDTDAVTKYVSTLADKYNTYGKSLDFNAKVDGKITVPWTATSIYGWQLNEETMVTKITDAIKNMQKSDIEPSWKVPGYGDYSYEDPVGKTYIEADISEQHFWVFKNGQVVLEDDFVSGKETDPERITPRGICAVWAKTPDTYLGTYEVQGYHTHVDYWMPFNYIGCGFHDLNRKAYGGTIYMYAGSHGCLNLKKETAKELFNTIDVGIPCIVHD